MDEQEHLKKQILKSMIYNIIAFAIIFCLFGIIMLIFIATITFSSVDNELEEAKEIFLEIPNESIDTIKPRENFVEMDKPNSTGFERRFNESNDMMISRRISNPKITVLLREEDGNVLNTDDLSRKYSNLVDQVPFNNQELDKIQSITLDGNYNYRMVTIKLNDSNNRYIQLMINIDTEVELVNHYCEIIVFAVVCGIVASIFASYFLSKRTLAPLENTLANQMEFVQNVSHELRTPLTIIQAKQELLLQEPNAKIIDKSEDILLTLNETKRLSKMTKDLMILARADDNRMTLDKEKVNIDTLVQDVVKPYEEIVEIDNKKLILDLKYDDTATVDTSKLYQVLVILLDNAIKYTEANDTITVKTYGKDNKCFIEVIDTGIGISDEAIGHVFERFYREDKSRTRSTGGSGLGLSIADAIIRAHGGTIKASHNGDKGTIFTIKINK